MYKIIITFLIVLTTSISYANSAFNFSKLTYKQALKESKAKKKDVFLFFNLPENEFCRSVEKEVFERPEVSDVYQEKFINLTIDPNTKEGEKLAKKFSINAFPSIVFINGKEQIIHKIVGVNAETDMLNIANRIISKKGTLKYFNEMFDDEPAKITQNHRLFLDYINILYNAGEGYSDKVNQYFNSLTDSELKLPENVDAIIKFSENIYSREFTFFAHNFANIKPQAYNQKEKFLKLENVISNQIIDAIYNNPKINPVDTLNAIMDYFRIEQREQVESRVMLDYYGIIKKDKDSYANSLQRYMMLNISYLSPSQITDYCNYVLENNNKELYQEAIMWSEEAINGSKDFDVYYTRIKLLIKSGRTDEARDEIQRVRDTFGDKLSIENDKKLKDLKLDQVDFEEDKMEIVR
jgi:thioredoxin-related protein